MTLADHARKKELLLDLDILSFDPKPDGRARDIPLCTHEGISCGTGRWWLFQTPEEPGNQYEEFMNRIPLEIRWPLALIENLEVHEEFRKQGNGRRGLQEMISSAKSSGAVCMILKVGWGPNEDPDEACLWRSRFYGSEGFIKLQRSEFEPNLMYCNLTQRETVQINQAI